MQEVSFYLLLLSFTVLGMSPSLTGETPKNWKGGTLLGGEALESCMDLCDKCQANANLRLHISNKNSGIC